MGKIDKAKTRTIDTTRESDDDIVPVKTCNAVGGKFIGQAQIKICKF